MKLIMLIKMYFKDNIGIIMIVRFPIQNGLKQVLSPLL